MSMAAMRWAWQQALAPPAKLLLMALADRADAQGVCWPSIPTLAQQCRLSPRTVQRLLQELAAAALLRTEPRFRADGSRTSNRYSLALGGGENLTPPPDTADRCPCHRCQGAPDRAVTPRTTTRTLIESPPLPSVGVHADKRGGGFHQNPWWFPQQLSEDEQRVAEQLLRPFPERLAQQLLDELSGRLAGNEIRHSPLAYLRGLVKRARAGEFTPEVALQVEKARERRRQTEIHQRQAEEAGWQALQTAPHTKNNPLVEKLMAIRNRPPPGKENND